MIGKRISKTKLFQKFEKLKIKKYPLTLSDDYGENIPPYCGLCGCEHTEYLERLCSSTDYWAEMFCLRCGEIVGCADNSPFDVFIFSFKKNCENMKMTKRKYFELYSEYHGGY